MPGPKGGRAASGEQEARQEAEGGFAPGSPVLGLCRWWTLTGPDWTFTGQDWTGWTGLDWIGLE